MSRIDDLIQQYCPDGVKYRKLEELVNIRDNLRKPITRGNRVIGDYPYYGANGIQSYVNDFIFEGTYLLMGEDGSVLTKNGTPILNWVTGKFWVNNHAHVLEEIKEAASLRYLFHALGTTKIDYLVKGTPPKLNQKNLRSILIPVPPLEVQEEIVRILDNFTELEVELEVELEARMKQYEYYRDMILSELDNLYPKTSIKSVCLSTSNIRWSEFEENEFEYIDLSSVDRVTHEITNTNLVNSDNAPSRAKRIVITDDVIYATTRPTLKRFCVIPEVFNNQICSTGFTVLRANKDAILPKYLYYQLANSRFNTYVESNQRGSAYPAISDADVKKYEITLPPMEVQIETINKLDSFTNYALSITSGLPAEIEARRKQYEYYRNKLLTF
jgi:type I restriction enzyme S subunit